MKRQTKKTTKKTEKKVVERITFDKADYEKLSKLPEREKADIMVRFAQLAISLHEVDFAWESAQVAWAEARQKIDEKNEIFLREVKGKLDSVK